MQNPLLDPSPLPQFLQIHPEHVEPAVRELLSANRARVAELATVAQPTFATVIEPLEELHHRTSRAWSPVSHLNAVLNSEALRASYNACLPLLSAYHTDLAQSEPLYHAYRTIAEQEGEALAPVQRELIAHAVRDFRLAGVHLPAERKQRFKTAMLELAQLQAKFEENVLDATNSWTCRLTDAAELRGLNEMLIEQAQRRAREQGVSGWVLSLDQPTYVAVVTDAESESLRRAFYEAWTTRASDRGPSAGRWDNAPLMEEILRRRHEAAQLLDFPSYAHYALARRMARSVEEVLAFLHELSGAARGAARALPRIAGGAAALLSAAAGARGAVRGRRAAVRGAYPRARRRPGVASGRALLRYHHGGRRAGRQLLSRRLRASSQAQRRVDGRVRRPQAACLGRRAAGRVPGVQLPAADRGAAGAAHAR
jgi:oligopeptidase A